MMLLFTLMGVLGGYTSARLCKAGRERSVVMRVSSALCASQNIFRCSMEMRVAGS